MTRPAPLWQKSLASVLALAASLLVLLVAAGPASAAGVVNGGFESGNLEGWHQAFSGDEEEGQAAGGWYALSGTVAPRSFTEGGAEELEEEIAEGRQHLAQLESELEQLENESEPTEEVEEEIEETESALAELEELQREELGTVVAPYQGSFDAVADEEDPSSMILYQDVALEAGVPQELSLYFNFHSFAEMAVPSPNTLSAEVMAENQQVRVDVMKAGSPPESLAPSDILTTLYATTDSSSPRRIPWTHLSADLSAYAGQTVRIRIAAVDNKFYLNAGVDDVTLSPIAPPPPPSNAVTFGKLAKNTRKGSATLTVNLPGPGVVTLANAGSKSAGASASKAKKAKQPKKPKTAVKKATLTATAAGAVKLPINPTSAALKYLKAKHSLSAKVAITFTPTGGTAKTVTKTVVLKLAKPKKKK
jgi:hypothetical protein